MPNPEEQEKRRLAALRAYDVLDTPPEREFDDLTALAAQICQVPIATITFVDEHRQWFKSRIGMPSGDTPRDIAFCNHTIRQDGVLVVEDAWQDARFAESPLVRGEPGVRFYAGATLSTPAGFAIGALCVVDRQPRQLSPAQTEALLTLSRHVMTQLELRRQTRDLARNNAALLGLLEDQKFSEKALRESESNFHALIDASAQIVWTGAPDGRALADSPSWRAFTGQTYEQWREFGWLDAIHPDDRDRTARHWREATEKGQTIELEYRLRHHSGEWRWTLVRAVPMLTVEGELRSWVGMNTDITERKRAEEQAAIFSDLGKKLGVAKTPKEAGEVIVDAADRLIGWDCTTLDIYLQAQDRLRRVLNYDIIDGRRQECPVLAPDGEMTTRARRVREHGAELILRAPPLSMDLDSVPFGDITRPSASLMNVPIRDGENVIGFFSIQSYRHNAYTEKDLRLFQALADHCAGALNRIHTGEALRLAEEKYRSIVEHAVEGIFQSTPEGRYVTVNPAFAAILGYASPEELIRMCTDIGRQIYADPATRDKLKLQLDESGVVMGLEHEALRKDGTRMWVRQNARAVRGADGKVMLYEGSIEDITARKKAEHRGLALARLGPLLAVAKTARDAADVITNIADDLFGWDSCFLDLYSAQTDRVQRVLNRDTVDGRRIDCPPAYHDSPPSPTIREVLKNGAKLVLKKPPFQMLSGSVPFGDVSRPSASLMYVPVRNGDSVIGTLSVQSYLADAYTNDDLELLQSLAESCGGALERIRAEESARSTHTQLQQLLDHSPAVIYSLRLTASMPEPKLVSENITRLLGYTSEQALRPGWWQEHIHPEDQQLVAAGLKEVLDHGAVVREYRIRHKRGRYVWVEDNQRLVLDMEGNPVEIAGVWTDITRRKEAEARIGDTLRYTHTILSASPVGIITYTAAGQAVSANDAAARIVGGTVEQLLHQNFRRLESWRKAGMTEAAARALENTTEQEMEANFVTTFGKSVSLLARFVPFSYEGETQLLTMLTDISASKEAEAALRATEERFRQLAENINEVFWMTDVTKHQMLYISPAYEKVWGRTCESLYQLPGQWIEAIHPEDRPRILAAAQARQIDGTYDEIYRIVRPDGSLRWVHDRAFPIRNENGKVYRIVGTAEDITTKRNLEVQLRQAQKMEAIGTLAGGIAHDFNNILGAINGFTDLAKMDSENNPTVLEYLDEVSKAGWRATDLVRQILTFSRQQEQQRKPLHLRHIVGEAFKLLRATIPSTIQFGVALANDAPMVLADATSIHQIVMNLGTNAAHAMRNSPGRLEVALENYQVDEDLAALHPDLRPGRYARLSISDSGHGMERAVLDRIFEPFFTTKAPGEGTGLGLSVVHGIMQAHEGCITVYSQPGEGTQFRLYFPALASESEEAAGGEEQIPRGQGERILFVDDEEALVRLSKKILTRLGYEVETDTSPASALETLRANPKHFALVITDFTMPGMTGTDLARKILELNPGLPIILTTGYSASLTSNTIQAIGIRELLLKPLSRQTLGEAVHRLLRPG